MGPPLASSATRASRGVKGVVLVLGMELIGQACSGDVAISMC